MQQKGWHDNIVRCLGFSNFDDSMRIFLEPGLDLKTYLKTHKPDDNMYLGMISALNYLHSIKVYHCDVSLKNYIMVGDSIKLIDFGIARAEYVLNDEVYCPVYRAFELFVDDMEVDLRLTEIWALGCTIYEMEAGEHLLKECLEIEIDERLSIQLIKNNYYTKITNAIIDIFGIPDLDFNFKPYYTTYKVITSDKIEKIKHSKYFNLIINMLQITPKNRHLLTLAELRESNANDE